MNDVSQVQENPVSEMELEEMMKGLDPETLAKHMSSKQTEGFLEHLNNGATAQAMANIVNTFATAEGIPDLEIGDDNFIIRGMYDELKVTHTIEVIVDEETLNKNIDALHGFIDDQISHISHTVAMKNPGVTDDEELNKLAEVEKEKFLKQVAMKIRTEARAGGMMNQKFNDAILGLLVVLADDQHNLKDVIFNNILTVQYSDPEASLIQEIEGSLSGSALTHYCEDGGYNVYSNIEQLSAHTTLNDDKSINVTMVFTNTIYRIDDLEEDTNEFHHAVAEDWAKSAAKDTAVRMIPVNKGNLFDNKYVLTGFSGADINYMLIEIVSDRDTIEEYILTPSDMEESIGAYIHTVSQHGNNGMLKATTIPTADRASEKDMGIKIENSSWVKDGVVHWAYGVDATFVNAVTLDDSGMKYDVRIHGAVRTDESGHAGFVLTHQPQLS